MKKLLLATSALVGLAGAAAAEVSVSGDGRIGLRYESDVPTYNRAGVYIGDKDNWDVISRARVKFAMTGETDSGLSFGANLRADQTASGTASGGNNSMYKGTVWISGAYGRLTAGDVDSALESAVGDLPEVGLSGLNFYNEMQYTTSDFDSELYRESGLLYDYKIGDATLYASFMDNNFKVPGGVQRRGDSYALGAGYTLGNYTFGIGYEKSGVFIDPVGYALGSQDAIGNVYNNDATTWGISGGTSIAGFTLKAIYLSTSVDGSTSADSWSTGDYDVKQMGLGAEYDMANGVGLKGFYRKIDGDALSVGGVSLDNDVDIWGLGANYDLGGGAILKAGVARVSGDSIVYGQDVKKTVADFGVALNF